MFLYKNLFFFNIFCSFNPNHAYWNQRRLFSGNLPGMFYRLLQIKISQYWCPIRTQSELKLYKHCFLWSCKVVLIMHEPENWIKEPEDRTKKFKVISGN